MNRTGRLRAVREQLAEPGRFWVRYAPRAWPVVDASWIDLGRGTIGSTGGASAGQWAALGATELDDVLYLPPVPDTEADRRDRLVAAHRDRGTPVVAQVLPGDALPGVEIDLVVLDLLSWSSGERAADPARLVAIPGPVAAAWPLVAGIEVEQLWGSSLPAVLSEAGVSVLQGVAVEPTPAQRRRLAERFDESAALRFFHAAPPAPEAVVRGAAERGFAPLASRPLPRPPLVGAETLRLAGLLAETAELGERLGLPLGRCQAFRRAARWAEASGHDLAGLAREGNLGVLPWLEEAPRRLVEAAVSGLEPALLASLRGGAVGADLEELEPGPQRP